jgi:hypothetical protein
MVKIRTVRVAVWRAVRHTQGVSLCTAGIANTYRKTAGHIFTKPVQIAGKIKFFPLVSCFSS